MVNVGTDEKIYPIAKIALVVDALKEAGVPPEDALQGADVTADQLNSAVARISLNQVIAVFRNAVRLATRPDFAFLTGLRVHVATYGMYGFAILSSTNFRQTVEIAVQYHQLATPLTEIFFREENAKGVWTIAPLVHHAVDASLYNFLVEFQFGQHVSLHRDVMGPAFAPSELHVTFAQTRAAETYAETLGCPVRFGQSENRLIFDAAWLDAAASLGNPITYSALVDVCDALLKELELRTGLAGQVREVLRPNLGRDASLVSVSERLKIPQRTLRRKLAQEGTSFREIADQLRRDVAIKYLRDTDLTVEDIAFGLGFSDAANFRHAFRRWTGRSPNGFRRS